MQSVTPFLRLYEIQNERKFFITSKNSDQPIIIAITPLMNPTVVTTTVSYTHLTLPTNSLV